MELRALKALPWDVVVDGILPRLLERSERAGGTGLNFPTIKHRRPLPTSVELLDRLVALINEWYSDERDEVGSARITDLSLLRPHLVLRDLGVVVVPRPRSARHLFVTDCDSLCSSDPTLRWTADRQNTNCMATTLLASPTQTGKAVVLVASEIQIRGNSLKVFLRTVEGYECVRSVTSTEQAAVASLALVARRGGSRPGPTCGELVRLGKPGYCSPVAYQQTRDALEATRFTMSEIKSLSSTTSVWYTSTTRRGGGNEVEIAVEFPDVMGGLRGGGDGDGDGGDDDGELLLTVGACFVGLDFVQHAFFPLRLAVLEDLVKERARSGQAGCVFSRLNRMECSLEVPWAWEKRMFA